MMEYVEYEFTARPRPSSKKTQPIVSLSETLHMMVSRLIDSFTLLEVTVRETWETLYGHFDVYLNQSSK